MTQPWISPTPTLNPFGTVTAPTQTSPWISPTPTLNPFGTPTTQIQPHPLIPIAPSYTTSTRPISPSLTTTRSIIPTDAGRSSSSSRPISALTSSPLLSTRSSSPTMSGSRPISPTMSSSRPISPTMSSSRPISPTMSSSRQNSSLGSSVNSSVGPLITPTNLKLGLDPGTRRALNSSIAEYETGERGGSVDFRRLILAQINPDVRYACGGRDENVDFVEEVSLGQALVRTVETDQYIITGGPYSNGGEWQFFGTDPKNAKQLAVCVELADGTWIRSIFNNPSRQIGAAVQNGETKFYIGSASLRPQDPIYIIFNLEVREQPILRNIVLQKYQPVQIEQPFLYESETAYSEVETNLITVTAANDRAIAEQKNIDRGERSTNVDLRDALRDNLVVDPTTNTGAQTPFTDFSLSVYSTDLIKTPHPTDQTLVYPIAAPGDRTVQKRLGVTRTEDTNTKVVVTQQTLNDRTYVVIGAIDLSPRPTVANLTPQWKIWNQNGCEALDKPCNITYHLRTTAGERISETYNLFYLPRDDRVFIGLPPETTRAGDRVRVFFHFKKNCNPGTYGRRDETCENNLAHIIFEVIPSTTAPTSNQPVLATRPSPQLNQSTQAQPASPPEKRGFFRRFFG